MSDYTLIPGRFANVTPSDTTQLGGQVISLTVGGAGNLVVKGQDGTTATFVVIAGQTIKGKFNQVMAATTATGIVAGHAV